MSLTLTDTSRLVHRLSTMDTILSCYPDSEPFLQLRAEIEAAMEEVRLLNRKIATNSDRWRNLTEAVSSIIETTPI